MPNSSPKFALTDNIFQNSERFFRSVRLGTPRANGRRAGRILAGVSCLLTLGLSESTSASTVVFHDGKTVRDVTVLSETVTDIELSMPLGTVRFPRAVIRSIDGQLINLPAPVPPPPAASPFIHRWNFEWALLALLVIAGIWIRGLQWVRHDLARRQADPRVWTLTALFLPILGALIYAVATRPNRPQPATSLEDAPGSEPESVKPGWAQKFLGNFFHRTPRAGRKSKYSTFEFLDVDKSIQSAKSDEVDSGLKQAAEMLESAILARASDVHIEPTATEYRVRFRLDGLLHERLTYNLEIGKRMATALKTLAQIDVAEKRKAQDGRFRARNDDREVDFRVATANSLHGEKVVIRILDNQGGLFDLTSLGMSDQMLATFQNIVKSRNGIILATGPTGAGKTSTLYAALRQLDSAGQNIMTIEDPPEYQLPGATQLAVNPKAGVTYESGLRSILRQDPDVILIGEMRDKEAATVALRAALTGHLVLSSLHTKDAVGTISRLQDMGIERYQVASGLLLILAQRLVRVLCPHCRQPYAAKGDELKTLRMSFEPGTTLYSAGSCEHCLNTGFRGRTGIFELLVMDDDLRHAIGEGIGEASLEAMVVKNGFRSYRYDGAEKILRGITTVEEVLQAV